MTRYALQLLDDDPSTELIVLLSKPPHPDVLEKLDETINTMRTPVIAYFQGEKLTQREANRAKTLDGVAEMAVSQLRDQPYTEKLFEQPDHVKALIDCMSRGVKGERIVCLYTGGTLAKETLLLLQELAGEVSFDIKDTHNHLVVDLGEDSYTIGKPHPMIAPENRTEVLMTLAAGGKLGNCGTLLFDLVLGNGSHLNPAEELVSSLRLLKDKYDLAIPAAVAVIGTENDPQTRDEQIKILKEYGAAVFLKNSEAARFAAALVVPACRAGMLE
jgi:FdrA protein